MIAGSTINLPHRLAGGAGMVCLSGYCDAGQDEVDAGEELFAIVMPGQLRRHLMHERVIGGIELRPLRGDGREEGRPIRIAREEAGARGVPEEA